MVGQRSEQTVSAERRAQGPNASQDSNTSDGISKREEYIRRREAYSQRVKQQRLRQMAAVMEELEYEEWSERCRLDVFEVEPLPTSSPLLELDNVLLSGHVAGLDIESHNGMFGMCGEIIVALHKGEWPAAECVQNLPGVTDWKW